MAAPEILRIGHLVVVVRDLAASRRFYVDLLGLNVLHEGPEAIYLRGIEDREWTLKLERGDQPRVRQFGFKVAADRVLDEITDLARAAGLPARRESELDRPALLRMTDPFGFPLSFYFQSVKHPWLLQRYDLHRGPAIARIDHCNLFCPTVGEMADWYQSSLGFRLTEYTEDKDGVTWAAWMHRKGNVHDVAVTNGTGPRMHHFAYWVPEPGRIFQLCDILAGASLESAIERGPGRHGISNAFYLYLRDPDGHRIELYTSDYLTVDPDFEPIRWDRDDPRRQQLWGGPAPKRWFTEGTPVEGFGGGVEPVRESTLSGIPTYVA
ncbi:MAG: 3,4-dihydroxyphenylacetate 2,3-dioxygenase [Gemmatimonadetes bacterium]|nr:3,4-dihydroxyphenylacetate 2,3-dioxygenase [Gemmatimonadota bacterium]